MGSSTRDKLAALSDGELLRRARMIGKDGGDLDAAANGLRLVRTASQQRDLTSALAHAERYASAPNAKPNQRAEGRWAAAVVMQKLGSPEQARAAFDGWLQQFGADPELQKLVLDVQTRRAKL